MVRLVQRVGLLPCVLLVAACGSKVSQTGGFEVTIEYLLVTPGAGCLRLDVIPDVGKAGQADMSLQGRARSGQVVVAVARGEMWSDELTLLATLHAAGCGDSPAVATRTLGTKLPARGIEPVTLRVEEKITDGGAGGGAGGEAGGGEAGGSAGGGGIGGDGGGSAGGTAGGGAAGGDAGGAAGGTAGGTAGGAAGGAAGGTAGGSAGGTAGGTAGGAAGGAAGGSAGGAASFCSDPALMGCWPMNEGTGSTAHDGSPNRNDGFITGATWMAQGDGGFALSFSGANSEFVAMQASATLSSPNALTLEAWIYPTDVGTDGTGDRIIDKDLQNQYALSIAGGGGKLCVSLGTHDTCLGSIPELRWTHVGATWAGGNPVLWINGVSVGMGSNYNGPISASSQNVMFGDSTTNASASTRFKGQLRAVRIYSRAKTAAEMCAAAGRSWTGTMCPP